MPNHKCSSTTCDIEEMDVFQWKLGDQEHTCMPKHCMNHPAWTAKVKPKRIDNIFICKNTGIGHVCDESCTAERILNQDSMYVCCISGITFESASTDTWVPSARITSSRMESKDPKILNFKSSGGGGTLRAQQNKSTAEKLIKHLLFSPCRMYTEQRKYHEMKQDAEKSLAKYCRQCDLASKPRIFTEMVELYLNIMNRRRVFRDLLPKKRSIDEIAKTYAQRTCACWNLIVGHTPLGKESPTLFPIKTFVVSILYLMKRGLFVGGVQVLPKDYYLEAVLPEANTLDIYSIHKPAFTMCKNSILRSYREAHEIHQINPNELKANY